MEAWGCRCGIQEARGGQAVLEGQRVLDGCGGWAGDTPRGASLVQACSGAEGQTLVKVLAWLPLWGF